MSVFIFAIVVNNKIDGKPEAYKLFNLLALNGWSFLTDDKSVSEFTCQQVFKMPEGGKPANKEKLAEVDALVESTMEKPSMRQRVREILRAKVFDFFSTYIFGGQVFVCLFVLVF